MMFIFHVKTDELNNPLSNISKLDEKLLEEVLFKRLERGISKDDGIKSNTCLEPKRRYILKAVKEIKLWGNCMDVAKPLRLANFY